MVQRLRLCASPAGGLGSKMEHVRGMANCQFGRCVMNRRGHCARYKVEGHGQSRSWITWTRVESLNFILGGMKSHGKGFK